MFRAAAVVRAIAVHNINVKNKLARVLLWANFSESKPRQTGTYDTFLGHRRVDRGETSVGNKIIVENLR